MLRGLQVLSGSWHVGRARWRRRRAAPRIVNNFFSTISSIPTTLLTEVFGRKTDDRKQ